MVCFSDSRDRFIIFSGGMPRASYGDRHTITVMQGDETHVVFDFTSRVVDFIILTRADESDTTDSRAGKQNDWALKETVPSTALSSGYRFQTNEFLEKQRVSKTGSLTG